MTRDELVAALQAHGIRFLIEGEDVSVDDIAPAEMIAELTRHPDPRLHLALTALFLAHPEYSQSVPRIAEILDEKDRLELQARYMAAVYLQRMWRTRLSFYLNDFVELPDLYSRELNLPSPNERYGKLGLIALAQWHARQSPYQFNRLASYYKSADLLFGQWIAEVRQHEFETTSQP